jgi:hypothetical protein
MKILKCIVIFIILVSCKSEKKQTEKQAMNSYEKGTFGYDLEFLRKYQKDLILLKSDETQIILSPQYQARVMTSTALGN